jgi:hypothetical protein
MVGLVDVVDDVVKTFGAQRHGDARDKAGQPPFAGV